MESLTKTQLVLLTLLISFVTSIATGIMTSSLLQSAPTNVTQTINRVVERTIEKASDVTGIKEIQVISEDDRVTGSIAQNAPSIVSVKQVQSDGSTVFYSVGLIVSKEGEILVERASNFAGNSPYSGVLSNGSTVSLALVKDIPDVGVSLFKITSATNQKIVPVTFTKSLPKLGQTVILVEGGGSDITTLVGRIANIQGESTTTPRIITIDVDSAKNNPGAPILDLSGNVLGIRKSDTQGGKAFIFGPRIVSAISK